MHVLSCSMYFMWLICMCCSMYFMSLIFLAVGNAQQHGLVNQTRLPKKINLSVFLFVIHIKQKPNYFYIIFSINWMT